MKKVHHLFGGLIFLLYLCPIKLENMKTETAVDWLFDKLLEETETGELRYHLKHDIIKMWEQAKEMEKQQIIDAYNTGNIDGQIFGLQRKMIRENGEEYYNEIFNK